MIFTTPETILLCLCHDKSGPCRVDGHATLIPILMHYKARSWSLCVCCRIIKAQPIETIKKSKNFIFWQSRGGGGAETKIILPTLKTQNVLPFSAEICSISFTQNVNKVLNIIPHYTRGSTVSKLKDYLLKISLRFCTRFIFVVFSTRANFWTSLKIRLFAKQHMIFRAIILHNFSISSLSK